MAWSVSLKGGSHDAFDAAFQSVFSAMGYGAVPLCTFRFCLQPATGIQAEASRESAIGLP